MYYKFNLAETLADDPKFAIFVKGLTIAGLLGALRKSGPFTIFAPSNLAFTTLPESKLVALMQPINRENLAEIMKYHVVEGKWLSGEIAKCTSVVSLQSQRLRIEETHFGFKVNDASLQCQNIEASNGVIHGIKAVLFPAIATGVAAPAQLDPADFDRGRERALTGQETIK